jgi:hypothetical protein
MPKVTVTKVVAEAAVDIVSLPVIDRDTQVEAAVAIDLTGDAVEAAVPVAIDKDPGTDLTDADAPIQEAGALADIEEEGPEATRDIENPVVVAVVA